MDPINILMSNRVGANWFPCNTKTCNRVMIKVEFWRNGHPCPYRFPHYTLATPIVVRSMNIHSSKHLSPKTCTEGVLTISNETVPPGVCYKSYLTVVIFLANKQIVWRGPVPNKKNTQVDSPFHHHHHFTITTSGSLTTPQPVVQKEFAPASQKQPVPWWRYLVDGSNPKWKKCASQFGSFHQGSGWK